MDKTSLLISTPPSILIGFLPKGLKGLLGGFANVALYVTGASPLFKKVFYS
jgi:hypothetical protein